MPDNTVFAVASAKGGVGKTTSSINLGTALAARGLDVVVVELDLAMANVADFLSLSFDEETDPTMHDVLAGEIPVTDALYDAPGGAVVAPSGTSLDALGSIDVSRLGDAVETLDARFDRVILDTGAGVNSATTTAITVADETILVSTPRVASIRDTEKTRTVVERNGGDVRGLVLTQAGTGSSPGSPRLSGFLGVELLCTVPQDPSVHESQDAGVPVVHRRSDSDAARAYVDGAAALVESSTDGSPDVTVADEHDESVAAQQPSKEALEAQGWTFPGATDQNDTDDAVEAPEAEGTMVDSTDRGTRPTSLSAVSSDGGAPTRPDAEDGRVASVAVERRAASERSRDDAGSSPADDDGSSAEREVDDDERTDDSLAGRVSSILRRSG